MILPPAPPAVVHLVDAVANIRDTEPKPYRVSDISAFADMLPQNYPWVASGAEIDNQVSKFSWVNLLGGEHVGTTTETPVSFSGWTLLGHEIRPDTKGIPGIDPARKTVETLLQDPASGVKVAVLADHRNHLAFGLGQNPASRAGWFLQYHRDRALAIHLRDLGYIVFINEDGNHSGGPIRYTRHQVTVVRAGTMQITAILPVGITLHVVRVCHEWTQQGIHTDHPLLAAHLVISRA